MKSIIASLVSICLAAACNPAIAATITGTVSDTTGAMVTGAQVVLSPMAAPSHGSPTSIPATPRAFATVSASGQYEFENVAEGKYWHQHT